MLVQEPRVTSIESYNKQIELEIEGELLLS